MSDFCSCSRCPECGERVHETAGLDYILGLLAPVALAAGLALSLRYIGVLNSGESLFFVGMVLGGGVVLVASDRHIPIVEY